MHAHPNTFSTLAQSWVLFPPPTFRVCVCTWTLQSPKDGPLAGCVGLISRLAHPVWTHMVLLAVSVWKWTPIRGFFSSKPFSCDVYLLYRLNKSWLVLWTYFLSSSLSSNLKIRLHLQLCFYFHLPTQLNYSFCFCAQDVS